MIVIGITMLVIICWTHVLKQPVYNKWPYYFICTWYRYKYIYFVVVSNFGSINNLFFLILDQNAEETASIWIEKKYELREVLYNM